MIRESRAGSIFTRELAGDFDAPRRAWARLGLRGETWVNYIVSAPVEHVRAALAGEPLAHLTIVNTPEDCVIGGEASACERVLARLGRERALPARLRPRRALPELEEVHAEWRALHHRPTATCPASASTRTRPAPGSMPTADAAADAITAQAARTLDFPRLVEQAWADGVRVFVEHGPRGLCSGWIKRILGDRDHLAVPLDVQGRSGLRQAMNAAAWLLAAGVDVHARALEEALSASLPPPRAPGRQLTLAAHAPAPRLPAFEPRVQVMARAPRLRPVLADPMWTAPVVDAPPAPVTKTVVVEPGPALAPSNGSRRPATTPAPGASAGVALAPASAHSEEMVRYLQQLGAVHRDFLQRSADVHQRFLALQRSTEATLFRAYAAVLRGTASGATAAQSATAALVAHASRRAGDRAGSDDTGASDRGAGASAFVARAARAEVRSRAARGPRVRPDLVGVRARVRRPGRLPPPGPHAGAAAAARRSRDRHRRRARRRWAPARSGPRPTSAQDSWYLHDDGRMPAGHHDRGGAGRPAADQLARRRLPQPRRARLPPARLRADLPRQPAAAGRHARATRSTSTATPSQGDVRLFFFHYDCRVGGEPRLTVRDGQAGFFTDEELASSAGVLWDPEAGAAPRRRPARPAGRRRARRAASAATELRAFAEGRPVGLLRPPASSATQRARAARRSIPAGRMLFLDEVADFDPRGGPWGRGYLRAETPVTPDDWFFAGHFKNDPCMPGTLMFEGCLQAMAFYLAASATRSTATAGASSRCPSESYPMRCRGQVTPELAAARLRGLRRARSAPGRCPTLYADLLCTVDGLKAFHARRVGLRLVPDWPLEHWRAARPDATQSTGAPRRCARSAGWSATSSRSRSRRRRLRVRLRVAARLRVGPALRAFGPMYARFDGTRRVARLPGPPYHFMSPRHAHRRRASAPCGRAAASRSSTTCPSDAWYFERERRRHDAVLRAAWRPRSSRAAGSPRYVGQRALDARRTSLFRNLDGTGTLLERDRPRQRPAAHARRGSRRSRRRRG